MKIGLLHLAKSNNINPDKLTAFVEKKKEHYGLIMHGKDLCVDYEKANELVADFRNQS